MQMRPALGPDSEPVRDAFALLQKSERKRQQRCLVEGLSNVLAALEAGVCIYILATDEYDTSVFAKTTPHIINSRASAKISDTKTPPGIYAVCKIPNVAPQKLERAFILDALSDPGNVGTIIRSAHAFGFDAVYLLPNSADPWSGKVLRSCAGYAFRVPIIEVESLSDLPSIPMLATVMDGSTSLQELSLSNTLSQPHAWVLGNESHGISEPMLAKSQVQIRVEMSDVAESLNAAVVAGICAYHSYIMSDSA
jgi:TrmH family RNA methyltransferase